MRRAAGIAVGAVLSLAALGLLGAGLADQRELAFTLGVVPGDVVGPLRPGVEACQAPVAVAERFTRVRFQVGTYKRRGTPLRVTVREGRRTIASGRLAGGYADVSQPAVSLDRAVGAGRSVSVCIANAGTRRVALYGGPAAAKTRSRVTVAGKGRPQDLSLVFLRDSPRSAWASLPAMFRRAAVFSAAWAGPWAFWLAAVAALLVLPGLAALAVLRAAATESEVRR